VVCYLVSIPDSVHDVGYSLGIAQLVDLGHVELYLLVQGVVLSVAYGQNNAVCGDLLIAVCQSVVQHAVAVSGNLGAAYDLNLVERKQFDKITDNSA